MCDGFTWWYLVTKKVAKYVDNCHMELSYELEIRKFCQTRQQGALCHVFIE